MVDGRSDVLGSGTRLLSSLQLNGRCRAIQAGLCLVVIACRIHLEVPSSAKPTIHISTQGAIRRINYGMSMSKTY
jgi:hypothetical protein